MGNLTAVYNKESKLRHQIPTQYEEKSFYHRDGSTLEQAPADAVESPALKVSKPSLGKALSDLLQWDLLDSGGQTGGLWGSLPTSMGL